MMTTNAILSLVLVIAPAAMVDNDVHRRASVTTVVRPPQPSAQTPRSAPTPRSAAGPVPIAQPGVVSASSAASRAEVIQATGIGRRPPQMKDPRAKLMARRAAEVVAVRNLSVEMQQRGRQLGGFRYVSYQTLPDGRIQVTVEATSRR